MTPPLPLGPLAGRTFVAVLFDMDGTLIDSIAAVERCWVRWAEEFGLDVAQLAGYHGVPARGIAERLLEPAFVDAAVARIEQLEMADTAGIAVLPGTLDALAVLTGATPQRCAIATSCTAPLARARVAAAGLPVPEVLVTASDVSRGKPAPDPYLLAADRLGVDPADCLVVEDAPAGLESARAAGCATLAVSLTTPRADLVADAVVPNLGAVSFQVSDGRVALGPRAAS